MDNKKKRPGNPWTNHTKVKYQRIAIDYITYEEIIKVSVKEGKSIKETVKSRFIEK